jgi:hypothetical protein
MLLADGQGIENFKMGTMRVKRLLVSVIMLDHDYAMHEKSLRGKLICVYQDPHTDDPCYCDQFTITMKKVRRNARRKMKKAGVRRNE